MNFSAADFKKTKVLVIGDVMLDEYWHGGTSRISPEAPVPVVHINHRDQRLGGAANVALGVAALGAIPSLLGLVGNDSAATTLEQLLDDKSLKHSLQRVPAHTTITKLRVLSRNHQMIRLDMEKRFADDIVESALLQQNYLEYLNEVDVVILSDYGKGTLAHSAALIATARDRNIPVVVDPKSADYNVYRRASVVAPNLKEFEAVVGPAPTVDIMVEKAHKLLADYEIDSIVITRAEKGLTVITAKGEVTHISAVAREVHDVTGAGDTVVAVLSVALASGLSLAEAATLGNIAAGIVVGKLGAATASIEEIECALGHHLDIPVGVVSDSALRSAVQLSKAKGERIIFTNGCFDILHAGHVMYLEQARALGDRLIVAVNDDASVKKLKGEKRPINTLEDRMSVLAGLKSVDWVVSFSEDTPERLIELLLPDIMVKGGDYQNIDELPGARFVLSHGGQVRILGLKEGLSTTKLIERIT